MSCCRRALPRRHNGSQVCVNCRHSLRDLVKERVEAQAVARDRGTFRIIVELQCPQCKYVNRLPVTFSKV